MMLLAEEMKSMVDPLKYIFLEEVWLEEHVLNKFQVCLKEKYTPNEKYKYPGKTCYVHAAKGVTGRQRKKEITCKGMYEVRLFWRWEIDLHCTFLSISQDISSVFHFIGLREMLLFPQHKPRHRRGMPRVGSAEGNVRDWRQNTHIRLHSFVWRDTGIHSSSSVKPKPLSF